MTNNENNENTNLDGDLLGLSLDPTAHVPLQSQLLEALRRTILSSMSHAGKRMPASRTLALELSVSRTTVQAAYDQLVSEGYLETLRGSGTFITDNTGNLPSPRKRRVVSPKPVRPWLPFQTGLPDLSLLPHAQWFKHLEKAWRMPEPDLLGRPDPCGWYPLRSAISDHLAAWRHLECAPEQVLITSGAREAIELIFGGLIDVGSIVVTEDPCWPKYHQILQEVGAKPFPVRIDEVGIDAANLPNNAAATIVTPSRHYPTGLSLPLSRRVALLKWANETGGLIVEDDYDSEFRYKGQPLPSLSGLDGLQRTLYLGSFSKLISPALRIGYLVVPEHLVSPAHDYLHRRGSRASQVPQPALASFMESGEFSIHLRRMRRLYAQRQAHLILALSSLDDLLVVEAEAAGMHLCLRFRSEFSKRISDREISRLAKDSGLAVGALSDHCALPNKPQALLLGYAGFDEATLSEAASTFINVLRKVT